MNQAWSHFSSNRETKQFFRCCKLADFVYLELEQNEKVRFEKKGNSKKDFRQVRKLTVFDCFLKSLEVFIFGG